MKSFIAISILLTFTPICFGQNFSVELVPLSGLVLPDSGGIISYRLTVTNQEAVPRSADIWGTVTRPNGTTQPVPGQTTETFLGNQSKSWQRQETLPPRAPVGYYTLKAFVGLYPSTIWAQAECQFQKQVLTGGVQQEWVARYNGPENGADGANDFALDRDGNIYVTGWSQGMGTGHDFATIKYNSNGIQQWVARYTRPYGYSTDDATAIALDGEGNVYVTGSSGSDYATIKYNAAGDSQWVRLYNGPGNGDDCATDVVVDIHRNVYVTGYSATISTYPYYYDYATIKYDPSGNQLWCVRYNGPGNSSDLARHLVLDRNGNVYITGESMGLETNYDYATIKYSTIGIEQWVVRHNGPANNYDTASDIILDHSGNVYVTGYCVGIGTDGDYTTIKYDSNGIDQWIAIYNGLESGLDRANCLSLDTDDNVYITGASASNGSSPYNYDYLTIKYNSQGNQIWVARYNGLDDRPDEAFSVIVDCYKNVFVTGKSGRTSTPSSYDDDYATVKYDSLGNQVWVARYNGLGNTHDRAIRVLLDIDCTIYVTGYSWADPVNIDYTTIKYSQPAIPNWQEVTAVPFGEPLPEESRLMPPSPNPFNQQSAISYKLQATRHVSLKVYDIAGRLVSTMVNGRRQAGEHEVTFDGSSLSSGVYFVSMQAGDFMGVQKIILLK